MKLFRIYTEHKNYDAVIKIVRAGEFTGFTVYTAVGYYGVKQKHALVIDIVTDNDRAVMSVAYAIKKHNKQKEVLVAIVPCGVKTV